MIAEEGQLCICITLQQNQNQILQNEELTVDHLVTDILSRNNNVTNNDSNDSMSQHMNMNQRIALSKAITLVESKSHRKRRMADVLLERLKQYLSPERDDNTIRSSFRLGIAGPPGGECYETELWLLLHKSSKAHLMYIFKHNSHPTNYLNEMLAIVLNIICIHIHFHFATLILFTL